MQPLPSIRNGQNLPDGLRVELCGNVGRQEPVSESINTGLCSFHGCDARRQAFKEAIFAKRVEDLRIVPVDNKFSFGFAELAERAVELVTGFTGGRLDAVQQAHCVLNDPRFDDGCEHSDPCFACAGGVLASAPVEPYPFAFPCGHPVRLEQMTAAGASEKPGQQRRVHRVECTGNRFRVRALCRLVQVAVDERGVRLKVGEGSGSRFAKVDTIFDDVAGGSWRPLLGFVRADDAFLVEQVRDGFPRPSTSPEFECFADDTGVLRVRLEGAVVCPDVPGRGSGCDVDAAFDGSLAGDKPVVSGAVKFELGEGRHDVEHQSALACGQVEVVGYGDECAAGRVDSLDGLVCAMDGAGESVEFGDDDALGLPGFDACEGFLEAWTVDGAAAFVEVGEDLPDLGLVVFRPSSDLVFLDFWAYEGGAGAASDLGDADVCVVGHGGEGILSSGQCTVHPEREYLGHNGGCLMGEMDEAYRKDSRAERKLRDFAASIDVLLNDPDVAQEITPLEVMRLKDAQDGLRRIADQLVAGWD
jgi:hypothetical protein